MLPAAESWDGARIEPSGPAGSPRTGTLGQQDPTTCKHSHSLRRGAVSRERGGSSLEPGRTRWVPSTAFREVFLQKLKPCCKNKILLRSGLLLGAVCHPRQSPGRRSRTLGMAAPVPGPPCPKGHLEGTGGRRCSSSLTQFVPGRGIQASSAGRFRAPLPGSRHSKH